MSTVDSILKGLQNASGDSWRDSRIEKKLPGPLAVEDLGPEARDALDDIVLFALRYFGIMLMPWQVESAGTLVELLESPDEEFLVISACPGSGKSTFFTKVVPAWLTCRDRAIRGMIGSATGSRARLYTRQLKNEFQRVHPVRAKAEDLKQGTARDAVATLAAEYGLFKPTQPDMWRNEAFVVAQPGEQVTADKEPTWEAFGLDESYIGGRYPFIIWDDLWDPKKTRSLEVREQLKADFTEVAEARLEPAGLFCLQGQRLNADDIYRYALDMMAGDTEDDDEEAPPDGKRKYHHLKFKAHYDDRCQGDHSRNAIPYPEGCLLYPRRVSWKRLSTIKKNNPDQFEVVYQQEDVDPGSVLVPMLWVVGGRGADGVDYPGCWDNDRDLCELPDDLSRPLVSIATADPSPANFWAIEHWVFHPPTKQRFLMDLVRKKMDAPDFLDWNPTTNAFSGIAQEWQARSVELHVPITHWVVESNAAQRFLLQYEFVKLWQRQWSVHVVPHETQRNKADPKFGIETIAPHYKFGRVRLPGRQLTGARLASLKLVDEVTRYPHGTYDDTVLAHWFFEFRLPRIYRPDPGPIILGGRPSWLRNRERQPA